MANLLRKVGYCFDEGQYWAVFEDENGVLCCFDEPGSNTLAEYIGGPEKLLPLDSPEIQKLKNE